MKSKTLLTTIIATIAISGCIGMIPYSEISEMSQSDVEALSTEYVCNAYIFTRGHASRVIASGMPNTAKPINARADTMKDELKRRSEFENCL